MVPSGEVADAPKIARAAAAVLLQFSAYDYALAGALAGDKTRVVSRDRYASVARALTQQVSGVKSASLSATSNAAGVVRDAVVSLADTMNDLGRDAETYADAGEPGMFAKVTGDVSSCWERLRALGALLPADGDLQSTIARGTAFTVSSRSETVFALSAGPYSTQADADAAAKRIGAFESVTRGAPFVVRVASYPTRAAADAAAAGLKTKGIDLTAISEERVYSFARGATAPDVELWREPVRIFDTWNAARRVAVSPDGRWIATGSDDGTVAIFTADGVLQSLPRFIAGVSGMVFSDDSRWLLAGGAVTATFVVPSGISSGSQMRFPAAIADAVFVPSARAFVAVSKGATGQAAGGPGLVGARAPDGAAVVAFPLPTPPAGGLLEATDAGELYIATPGGGVTDVEVLRVGQDRTVRGVVHVPGTAVAFEVDRAGTRGAMITDQGTYRFGPHATDPTATLAKVGPPVRDVAFGSDGTLYQLDKDRLAAIAPDGSTRWQVPLVDGRRLAVGARAVVLDGTDTVIAVSPSGAADSLGVDGTVQDVSLATDGKRVAVVVEGRRALVFDLP